MASENRPLVLVADDQPEITKLVSLSLENEGFRVITASDGPSALGQLSDTNPDVLLVDAAMPGMSGIDVLREVRASHPVPVILLADQGSVANISHGLDLGADDYVVKPFNPGELAARVRAVIRRSRRGMAGGTRSVGAAEVDLDTREVQIDGRLIRTSRHEWLLLELFLTNESRILLHDEILSAVWGPEYRDEIAYLRLWVGQLRRKLGIAPWEEGVIRTIQGLGYAYDPQGALPRMQSRRPHQPAAVGTGSE
ncbi:MAG: response regulator transcription factor [Chloroflexota bacterium]